MSKPGSYITHLLISFGHLFPPALQAQRTGLPVEGFIVQTVGLGLELTLPVWTRKTWLEYTPAAMTEERQYFKYIELCVGLPFAAIELLVS